MKITKIELQKNNPKRVSIYLDNAFWLGTNADIIIDCDLYVGKEITIVESEKIIIVDEYQRALKNAYNILSRRPQSEQEIRIKLLKHANYQTVLKVISRLKELGYVDDLKFTTFWIEERRHSRGRRQLSSELMQKGIAKDIIEEALYGFKKEDELEVARKLAIKKKISNIPDEKMYDKIGGFLARKGFDYEIISTILKENKKSCN